MHRSVTASVVETCHDHAIEVRHVNLQTAADLASLRAWRDERHRLLYFLGRATLLLPLGQSFLPSGVSAGGAWILAFDRDCVDPLMRQGLEFLRLESELPFFVTVPDAERRHWEDRFRYLQSIADRDAEHEAMCVLLKCSLSDFFRLSHVDMDARGSSFHTMRLVLSFIEKNYSKPIKLREIAEAASFSPAYLTDRVRRETGLPIHRWITHYRLAAAKRLLKDTTMPVSAIAEEVGFGEGSHFCKQFSRMTGLTPGAWRKSQRHNVWTELGENGGRVSDWQADASQLRTMMDSIPQLVWAKSEDGSLLYANRRWHSYTGLTLEQSAGWGWLAAVHPDERNRCLASWSAARAMGMDVKYHARLKRGIDSAYRWHLIHTMAASDGAVRWFGTATDVHDETEKPREF